MKNSHQAIGIDIGGSKTAVGLIDLDKGNVLREEIFDTPALGDTGEPYVARMKDSVGLCECRHRHIERADARRRWL